MTKINRALAEEIVRRLQSQAEDYHTAGGSSYSYLYKENDYHADKCTIEHYARRLTEAEEPEEAEEILRDCFIAFERKAIYAFNEYKEKVSSGEVEDEDFEAVHIAFCTLDRDSYWRVRDNGERSIQAVIHGRFGSRLEDKIVNLYDSSYVLKTGWIDGSGDLNDYEIIRNPIVSIMEEIYEAMES